MKHVTITRTSPGGNTWEIKMDRQDLPFYERHTWQKHKRGIAYFIGDKGRGGVWFHRVILKAKPSDFVEFLNGNKYDVRRCNIRIRNDADWRARKRKPFIRKVNAKGRPTGVFFIAGEKSKNGHVYVYPAVGTSFCYQRKERNFRVTIKTYGLAEAVRRVLWWRIDMIRKHGMEPNPELIQMLAAATVEAAKPKTRQREFMRGFNAASLYAGNVEYAGCKVIPWEVTARFDPKFKPNFRPARKAA